MSTSMKKGLTEWSIAAGFIASVAVTVICLVRAFPPHLPTILGELRAAQMIDVRGGVR